MFHLHPIPHYFFHSGVDIDECTEMVDNCHAKAVCTNTAGSFSCTCNNGFSGDGVTCIGKKNVLKQWLK